MHISLAYPRGGGGGGGGRGGAAGKLNVGTLQTSSAIAPPTGGIISDIVPGTWALKL